MQAEAAASGTGEPTRGLWQRGREAALPWGVVGRSGVSTAAKAASSVSAGRLLVVGPFVAWPSFNPSRAAATFPRRIKMVRQLEWVSFKKTKSNIGSSVLGRAGAGPDRCLAFCSVGSFNGRKRTLRASCQTGIVHANESRRCLARLPCKFERDLQQACFEDTVVENQRTLAGLGFADASTLFNRRPPLTASLSAGAIRHRRLHLAVPGRSDQLRLLTGKGNLILEKSPFTKMTRVRSTVDERHAVGAGRERPAVLDELRSCATPSPAANGQFFHGLAFLPAASVEDSRKRATSTHRCEPFVARLTPPSSPERTEPWKRTKATLPCIIVTHGCRAYSCSRVPGCRCVSAVWLQQLISSRLRRVKQGLQTMEPRTWSLVG
jgi:hypothetical protein